MGDITKHFSRSEFKQKAIHGEPELEYPTKYLGTLKYLCDVLEAVRSDVKVPLVVTSGYRSEEYNRKVGGVKTSQHIIGKAADIKMVPGLRKACEKLYEQGIIRGLGIYGTFIHVDIREGRKARW